MPPMTPNGEKEGPPCQNLGNVCVCVGGVVYGGGWGGGGHRQLASWHTKTGMIRSSLFCGQIFSPVSFVWLVWVAARPDKSHFV